MTLIEKLARGGRSTYRLRPTEEVRRAIALAYGASRSGDIARHLAGLDVAVRALEAGDMARAAVATVQLRLPDLTPGAFAKLAADRGLMKYSPDQPRDERGRWTSTGGTATGSKPVRLAEARSGVMTDAGVSSGIQVAESPADLKLQHEAARAALSAIWQRSQIEKREYFGLIYRTPDGTYHSTRAVPGIFTIVPSRTIEAIVNEVPPDAKIVASFHTHINSSAATIDERENFTFPDISTSRNHGWDAYLGTAISGRLRYYNFQEHSQSDEGRLDLH